MRTFSQERKRNRKKERNREEEKRKVGEGKRKTEERDGIGGGDRRRGSGSSVQEDRLCLTGCNLDGQEACSNMPVSRVPDLGRVGIRVSF